MSTKRCYYETLEVERTADESKLKAAFRKLAMKWHPDKNPGDAASEIRFKEINEAYEVLKDGDKRAAYDRFGHAAFEQGRAAAAPDSAPALPRHFPIFSKICSAWPGSAAAAAGASAAPTCATTWKSRWRKPFRARPPRSRFRSRSPASPVRAPAPRPAPSRRPARCAAAPAACGRRRASSRWSEPVPAARAAAR